MIVPFLDVLSVNQSIREEIDEAIGRVISSGSYILSNELEKFEESYAEYCDAKYAIGVGSGLDALELSIRACGLMPGDEVIVPANTFIATWLAVSKCGCMPIPVSQNEITFNIDPSKIERAITSKTKAIMPVHLYGYPADLRAIEKIAKKNNLIVIEDAAQAHGATYFGQKIGAHSSAVAWSFYPGKNLGCMGDGGAITTNDDAVAEKLRKFRNYGSSKKYVHEIQGTNSRLDELQAAILSVKLKYLDEWNNHRINVANRYKINLKNNKQIIIPNASDINSVWHLYVIKSRNRDRMQAYLNKHGIETIIHYPIPPYMQEAYSHYRYDLMDLSQTTELCSHILSLPISQNMTLEAVDYVSHHINNWSAKNE